MHTRKWIGVVAIVLALGLSTAVRAADTYKVDPVHSFVGFKISHMGVSYIVGRFNGPEGTFTIDSDAAKCSFATSVQTDNVDTGVAKRDGHLKSPDFFNAKQFPTVSFQSTAVKKTDDTHYEVTGDLTLHGVTKPITVTLTKVGTGKDPKGAGLSGLETTFTVKRSDYGMNFMVGPAGDDVTLTVNLEGKQQ